MSAELRLTLEETLGFIGKFKYAKQLEEIYIFFIQDSEKNDVSPVGFFPADEEGDETKDVQNCLGFIAKYYSDKYLPEGFVLACELYNVRGELVHQTYVQDKFGRGLVWDFLSKDRSQLGSVADYGSIPTTIKQ